MHKENLELYTDYLLGTFGYATARGLSAKVNGQVRHDQVPRVLSGDECIQHKSTCASIT